MKAKSILAAASAVVAISISAARATPNLTTLVNFTGLNGANPVDLGGLLLDSSGNLYGTTSNGGSSNNGTIFKIAAGNGSFGTLVTFTGFNGNGSSPDGLIADPSGNLYGTTYYGGPINDGTIFKITAGTNAVTTLATFNVSNGPAGKLPNSGLTADASGNFYGVAVEGGDQTVNGNGYGTVFKLAAGTNNLTALAKFEGTNGSSPLGPLIADTAGNLYGTTDGGGSSNDGTVFKITAGTGTITTLAIFNGSNGSSPIRGLVADASGNLYGTTTQGGSSNDGTVFKIAAGTDTLTTLATFNGSNGGGPNGLIFDAAGDLFGTTGGGGSSNDGTVFEIATGTYAISTLATFTGTNGDNAKSALVADAFGNLYGTTLQGGSSDEGTVFELTGTSFVVPEPSSLSLLGVGGIAILGRRRRVQSGWIVKRG